MKNRAGLLLSLGLLVCCVVGYLMFTGKKPSTHVSKEQVSNTGETVDVKVGPQLTEVNTAEQPNQPQVGIKQDQEKEKVDDDKEKEVIVHDSESKLGKLKYIQIPDIRSKLKLQSSASAAAIKVKFLRDANGLCTTIGSSAGGEDLKIEKGVLKKVTAAVWSDATGTVPKSASIADAHDAGIELIRVDKEDSRTGKIEGSVIVVKSASKNFTIPIGDHVIGSRIVARGSKFAATVKETKTHSPVSIILIDIERGEAIAELPYPERTPRHAYFVLDPTANALAVVDTDAKSMHVVDLEQFIQKPAN